MEKVGTDYSDVHTNVKEAVYLLLQKRSSFLSVVRETSNHSIDKYMWRNLRSVGISMFDENTSKYASWIAAFKGCVDNGPATPEYKLLLK